MNAKANNLIIYDDSCPMCKAYTQGFVGMGLLSPENRVGFANTDDALRSKIDIEKGRHEIPLLDKETGQVRYGLKALTYLLSLQWPFLAPILKSKFLYFCLYPFYQVITYNRRLIANSRSPQEGYDCAPDFNAFYRAIYLLIGLLITLSIGLSLPIPILGVWVTLFLIASVFIMGSRRGVDRWDAFGHLGTVGIITALLTWPLLGLSSVLPLWGTLGWGGFALLIGLNSWRKRMI